MTTVFTLVVGGESGLKKTAPLTVYDVQEAQRVFDELVYKAMKQDGAINGFVTNEETKRVPYKM
jgi:hypothetical protein